MRIVINGRIGARAAIDDKFRFAALVLVGGLVTAAVLMALSASAARTTEQRRSSDVTGVLSDKASSSDLLVLSSTKRIAGERIDLSFIETLGDDSIRPVGVDRLPPVGMAIVSPALREAVEANRGRY